MVSCNRSSWYYKQDCNWNSETSFDVQTLAKAALVGWVWMALPAQKPLGPQSPKLLLQLMLTLPIPLPV